MENLVINGICRFQSGRLFLNEACLLETNAPFNDAIDQVVKDFNIVHPRFGKLDRLSQLGYACTEILLQASHTIDYQPSEVSLVFVNSSSSLDTDFRFQKSIDSIASPSLFVYTLPNIVLAEICIKNGFKGDNTFLISEEPDPDLYFLLINQLFSHRQTKICIAGWVEILGEEYNCRVFTVEGNNGRLSSKSVFSIENLKKYLF
jgi:hypothetical protein